MSARGCDAFVAGGGLAGSAAAIALTEAGMHVVLVEKSREAQHKVCGEFLSHESLPFLAQLGVNPVELGAPTLYSVRLAAHNVIAEAQLPAPALSLTRKTLDEALLTRAQQAGVDVRRGCAVESLTQSSDGDSWLAELSGNEPRIASRHAFLATGKHNLRGWPREDSRAQTGLVAFKMYFALTAAQQAELDGHVELLLYPGGYAGLQPVEGGRANLCLLVTEAQLRRLDGRWENLLDHMQAHVPHLARRLVASTPLIERPLALSSIPYGYCVAAQQPGTSSPWRIGDQAAVIPSFCGDGMALALATARRAAALCLQGATPDRFHAETRRDFRRRLQFATLLSRMMIATPVLAQAARVKPSLIRTIFHATRLPASVQFSAPLD